MKAGNTEGSRVLTRVFTARKNLTLKLTTRQLSIVLGSVLGDAYIHRRGKICFEHGAFQKDYLFWKYHELKSAAYPKVSKVVRHDRRLDTPTISWRFYLRQYFRPLRRAFYPDDKKVVPLQLQQWFSPLLIAVWYMDDGYLENNAYPFLMTEGFATNDIQRLVFLLHTMQQIESDITSKKRIRISQGSRQRFFQLIEPHIHENLRYKLP